MWQCGTEQKGEAVVSKRELKIQNLNRIQFVFAFFRGGRGGALNLHENKRKIENAFVFFNC